MPSKKKNSKTPSKLSNSDNHDNFSSSPSSPSVSSSISSSPLFNNPNLEEDFSSYLDEASSKFPSLVSRTAFVGRVSSNAVVGAKGCRIWLSESAMISSSISPGSLVSVSVASMDKDRSGFPLNDLSDECASHFGFDLAGNSADEAGNLFALATAYPSSKVLKNGVCFSSNFSNTLGCPAPGRIVFVYPVTGQPLTDNGNSKSQATFFSLNSCKELYLFPIYSKSKPESRTATSSHVDLSKESRNGQVENSEISSPKTPSLSQSRAGSPSPSHSHTCSYKKSASFDILDVKEVIRDDSSRKLLELCTVSWLCSRTLLSGNFVIVPVLSKLCIFQVVGSKKSSSNIENFDNKNHDSFAQDSYLGKDVVVAFSIDQSTKIHLLLPGDLVVETSARKSLALPQPGYGCVKDSSKIDFTKLGGLSKEFAVLKDLIVSSAVKDTLASLGLRPAKGVLLHGPPGTGKTTLAQQCALEAGVNLFSVNGSEVFREYYGESEQALHEVFAKASQAAPAVVFIDEIDVIAPARKDGGGEVSQRMVATLLDLMDGISRTNGLVVIAATNRPDSIEPALRRPGRLDREIEIGVPSSGQRYEILLALLSEMQHSFSDKDVQQLAIVTHGFVGADLVALCTEAARARLQKCVQMTQCDSDFKLSTNALDSVCQDYQNLEDSVESNLETDIPCSSETQSSSNFRNGIGVTKNYIQKDILRITSEDFEKARIRVKPSAMREIHLEVPKVSWEDVGGQMEVKVQLREAVEWPQKHKDDFKRIGTRPPTGILLFGPPGCSKTLLARAVASEAGLNFFAVKGPELFSKWVGESEKAVCSLFAKARANAPSIIFFDEIDGLAVIRGKEGDGVSVGDRVITQLLVELDGLQQRGSVTVIAATNRPEKIDSALLRPGRFDRRLYVGPPNKKDREDIFRVHLQRKPCNSNVSISELSLLTEGCTGADIALICNQAAFAAMEEDSTEITMEHLKSVIQHVRPSDVQMYQELSKKFQRTVHSTANENDLINEQPCSSSKQTGVPFWSKIRSDVVSIFRIPTFLQ